MNVCFTRVNKMIRSYQILCQQKKVARESFLRGGFFSGVKETIFLLFYGFVFAKKFSIEIIFEVNLFDG